MSSTTARPTVLLEMRPALDGYAGIPQETRLLFRALCELDTMQIEGLLQTSHQFLSPGTPMGEPLPADAAHRYARLVISVITPPNGKGWGGVAWFLQKKWRERVLQWRTRFNPRVPQIELSWFEPTLFKDFVWQTMFSKTLAARDFTLVTAMNYRVCRTPWNVMQSVGINSSAVAKQPLYPLLDTQGVDVFIAQTPYPGRLTAGTTLVVRYYDAFPVLMPHLIKHKARHEAGHYHALISNARSGAWFVCGSEASRQDLIRLVPEAAPRAVTIHVIVSHYFFAENSDPARVAEIIRTRTNVSEPGLTPAFADAVRQDHFYQQAFSASPFAYLLVVSTIEPRKNHQRLFDAWAHFRATARSSLKLVVVGNPGWDCEPVLDTMRKWAARGELFALNNVPAEELRVLYRHAVATVCPSVAEGFDYSGVEAMLSGGVVLASDIPVHREVYADAALYFDPYCPQSLSACINELVSAADGPLRQRLLEAGKTTGARYLPERILPQWRALLEQITQHKG